MQSVAESQAFGGAVPLLTSATYRNVDWSGSHLERVVSCVRPESSLTRSSRVANSALADPLGKETIGKETNGE